MLRKAREVVIKSTGSERPWVRHLTSPSLLFSFLRWYFVYLAPYMPGETWATIMQVTWGEGSVRGGSLPHRTFLLQVFHPPCLEPPSAPSWTRLWQKTRAAESCSRRSFYHHIQEALLQWKNTRCFQAAVLSTGVGEWGLEWLAQLPSCAQVPKKQVPFPLLCLKLRGAKSVAAWT